MVAEPWTTAPKVLANVKGRVFQGSALRFFEYIDMSGSIASAAATAEKSDLAVVFVSTTNEIESEGLQPRHYGPPWTPIRAHPRRRCQES
jgi:beta-glucosidase